jgi:hypothetical protein
MSSLFLGVRGCNFKTLRYALMRTQKHSICDPVGIQHSHEFDSPDSRHGQ